MTTALLDAIDRATAADVASHLRRCDDAFVPRLSSRVALDVYATKLVERAVRLESWDRDALVGLVAMYFGADAFISNVSVDPSWAGRGVATRLLERAIAAARARAVPRIRLEVARANYAALRLYERHGFVRVDVATEMITMQLVLNDGAVRER